jgi:hypothetical protein
MNASAAAQGCYGGQGWEIEQEGTEETENFGRKERKDHKRRKCQEKNKLRFFSRAWIVEIYFFPYGGLFSLAE